ncbi:SafA/ExsA family spore coat assembly protein [Pseudogracilibacillus auburnensis]|uniref:SafA/ExsA family spore coat assembly protein n=1 Tax=Pseudogracilibacillus auburnensis TaxID=1494959 RepID=UPI001F62477E|nr:SafA/ExsA family spore coat assembly protein [Pseudogracilibacillus auburnensis]
MKIHIVQKGDTLFEIAKNYGVNFEEIVKLNPQLSSPDMIMPGMKIKIPSELKQVKKTTDMEMRVETKPRQSTEKVEKMEKATRVEPTEEREARTPERPMGEIVADDHVEAKQVRPKAPTNYQPLYPVKPIIQAPPMPNRTKMSGNVKEAKQEMERKHPEKSVRKEVRHEMKEEKQEQLKEMQKGKVEEIQQQPPTRPITQSEYMMEKPMYQRSKMHCCCCPCMQSMYVSRHHPSPWHHRGTYFMGSPFMPRRMNYYSNNQMNYMPNYQMAQMSNQQMNEMPGYHRTQQQMNAENHYGDQC